MKIEDWSVMFRTETERERRYEILERAVSENFLSQEEAALRRRVLDARYAVNRDQEVDCFIRGWMRMSMLRQPLTGFGRKGQEKRELAQVMQDWQMDLVNGAGECGEAVLYDELYNMARRYIELCESDRQYGSVVLGFGRMKKETRTGKIAADFRAVLYDVPKRLNCEKELSLFVKAAGDAFADYFPGVKL